MKSLDSEGNRFVTQVLEEDSADACAVQMYVQVRGMKINNQYFSDVEWNPNRRFLKTNLQKLVYFQIFVL